MRVYGRVAFPTRVHSTTQTQTHGAYTHSPYHDVSAQHAEANAVSEQNSLAPGRVETLQVALVQVLQDLEQPAD